MSLDQILYYFSVYIPPLLFAITLHEASHGYAARYFGDNTAYVLGRVSLNPINHIDLIGTVVLPGVLILMGSGFIFGWAKPVPVSIGNLRRPKQDMIYVALAGPLANLVMATLWAIVLKVWVSAEISSDVLIHMALFGIKINIILMLFNLIPILPLDGGRILEGLLPTRLSMSYAKIEPYGMMIVVALLVFGGINRFLVAGVNLMAQLLLGLVGL
ncbi:peptidase M50 [Pelistega indica]|uniref:Peptidase M50 n=1 Tax=Pelistega indica TaxID=1414851 RepID=V8G2M3_9BURK|nr:MULTISPECIES: site-2 protease family protein [Pelistega]ETD70774.1 peptidase M50 [Pelistega indica]